MYRSTNQDIQYILPLDCLDRVLIHECLRKRDERQQLLWSTSNMDGETTYYQVELKCNNDEDSYCKPMETVKCHTCNMEVPQMYIEEHNKSEKHQNFKRLTLKVLENISKQIKVFVDDTENCTDDELYYCESCCRAVLKTQEREHKLSGYHMNSVENDDITNKFLNFYIQDQDVKIISQTNLPSNYEVESNSDEISLSDSSESDSGYNNSTFITNDNIIQQSGNEEETEPKIVHVNIFDIKHTQKCSKAFTENVQLMNNDSTNTEENVAEPEDSNVMADENANRDKNETEMINHMQVDIEHVKNQLLCTEIDVKELKLHVYNESSDLVLREAYSIIYKQLLNENNIKRLHNSYFCCQICNMWVKEYYEIEHMFSDIHKDRKECYWPKEE